MRHFLIAYFHRGGKGRSFVTAPDDRVVTSSIIEDWERQIERNEGLTLVGISSFQALECPPDGGSSTDPKKLQNLVERMASMLCDLNNNYGWDELGDSLDDVLDEARELGCHVEDEGDE